MERVAELERAVFHERTHRARESASPPNMVCQIATGPRQGATPHKRPYGPAFDPRGEFHSLYGTTSTFAVLVELERRLYRYEMQGGADGRPRKRARVGPNKSNASPSVIKAKDDESKPSQMRYTIYTATHPMHCEDPIERVLADNFFQTFLDNFYDIVPLWEKDKLRSFYNHCWDSEILNVDDEKQAPFLDLHFPETCLIHSVLSLGAPVFLSVLSTATAPIFRWRERHFMEAGNTLPFMYASNCLETIQATMLMVQPRAPRLSKKILTMR